MGDFVPTSRPAVARAGRGAAKKSTYVEMSDDDDIGDDDDDDDE